MSFLPEPVAVRFDEDNLWVSLADGRTVGVPLAWYPRLLGASAEARLDLFLSPSGIHWPTIDEDVPVEALLAHHVEFPAEPKRAA
ncbi:MAG: DUF2442 domain-containing protein [Novosphingobium sp.]|nr:DUF2442 domain-containing protein [Novosphingobium sp.]MBX9644517.1 DUF2442 domain-containing protein [Novosphingobium sp.]